VRGSEKKERNRGKESSRAKRAREGGREGIVFSLSHKREEVTPVTISHADGHTKKINTFGFFLSLSLSLSTSLSVFSPLLLIMRFLSLIKFV